MSSSEIRAVLVDAVRELRPEFAELQFTGDEHLSAELGLDSVARVELLVALEEEFGIEDEVDPRIFMTPATMNALVEQLATTEDFCP
ncbi:acyl carrier protein [Streptomyces sp. NPDC058308]|uniref:acyl carrier protein n=1 Tax=Streptomyces sp. NPDC058308 TaxID=3346440 RepID=UPI0036E45ADC